VTDTPHDPLRPETWVDAHGDALFRIAMLRVRDAGIAEDLVQEAFLAACRSVDSFRGGSSEFTWLVAILNNKIADHVRRKNRFRPATDLGPEADSFDRLFDERGRWLNPPSKWDGPDGLREKEFMEVLRGCLKGVPERQAEAFWLRLVDERPAGEVCNILEVTATNLGVLIHRARQHLRNCIEHRWFGRTKS